MEEQLKDAATGKEDCHHLDPLMIQYALKKGVERAGLDKPAGCHAFAILSLSTG